VRAPGRGAAIAWALAVVGFATHSSPALADEVSDAPARATVYAFFATWCVPCRVELPHIQRLSDRFAGQGARFVLVSEDAPSDAQLVPAFLRRQAVDLPWVLDAESELLEKYNAAVSVPFVVVADRRGDPLYTHAGFEPGDELRLERALVSALARRPDARAGGGRGRVTATTQSLGVWRTSRFNGDDGRLRALAERLEVRGQSGGRFSALARVDGALIEDEVGGDDDDLRLERARLRADLGWLRLDAGDSYVRFGHGVSLSLRRLDTLGLDTSLRGGRAELRRGRVSATAIAGWTNPQNLDPLELAVVDDASDLLAGAQASLSLGEVGWVAPYALYAAADGAADDGGDASWGIGGVATEVERGSVRVAAEVAAGRRQGLALRAETPWAAYAAARWSRGRVTALVEGKAYRHWAIGRSTRALPYHEPPTLERVDQEVPGNEDAVGGRARADARFAGAASVFGNLVAYRYSNDGSDPLSGDLAVHSYAGLEKRRSTGESGSVQVGYRRELFADGGDKLWLWHVDLDATWPLSRRLAVTLDWNHREEKKILQPSSLRFRRGLAAAGLSLSGLGSLSLLYGYSTEAATTPTHYPGAELRLHLMRGGSARPFMGRLAGGRVCVSGTCRDVPPFSGARLDLVLTL